MTDRDRNMTPLPGVVKFKLPEFSTSTTIAAKVHVNDHTKSTAANYDMIRCMGTDLRLNLALIYPSEQGL